MNDTGGTIVSLVPGGLGEQIGLQVGDRLLAINGHPVRDVIDVQFYGSEEELVLTVRRGDRELVLHGRRLYSQSWGVEFAEPVFDGIRTCTNHCPFCFVAGLPPGLRSSLYLRDDDYRLSFLFGNFITLTNLNERDWERLAEQRLSPLYVSVQATEPDLRRRLLGGRPIPDICEQIERLGRIGIAVEAQVVLCPGLNDGQSLERTVEDLWHLRQVVESVALVPVGATRYQQMALQPVTPEEAAEVLAFADGWRRRAYREVGRRFLYPSDEFYLLAGRPVPGATAYDGFPQLANGVGLVRRFLDDWTRTRQYLIRRFTGPPAVESATLVTGRLPSPLLEEVARDVAAVLGIRCQAVTVANRFFGERVTVAGLLTAEDVVQELQGRDLGELVILPRSMFDAAGKRTLDDWTAEQIAETLGRRVALAAAPSEVIHLLVARGCRAEHCGVNAPSDSA